ESCFEKALLCSLSRLRSLVGREAILLQDGYLTLNPRVCWIDTWALERLLNQAEKTDQADPHHDKLMEKILSLYQGPFLEEDGMPWAYAVRERLASKFVRSLRRRGRYLEQKGLYEEAIAFHPRGLETDPLSEGLYRCLMACHHRLGRRAEALALYQRCRKTLSLLQGIDPSRETEALYQRIKCAG
ncbi:MAG TPA: AAA family ATPase, partial [Nitrospiraceae bacterium]|nr:AAA family ATPase [Nitrospiraceae bacterium]